MEEKKFTVLITTHNRREELKKTLYSLSHYISPKTQLIICDDASTDGTYEFICENYPEVQLIRNENRLGLIYSRNRLMGMVNTEFAVHLDDDANFLLKSPLKKMLEYFNKDSKCAVLTFRTYWNELPPKNFKSDELTQRVKYFIGCGHAWRMKAWRAIPPYPSWFEFYGEEEYASIELFKKNWKIVYLPEILIHHRVNVKKRRNDDSGYYWRQRRSLRSGWYLYVLFYPLEYIPKRIAYSIWMQLKIKAFKGEVRIIKCLGLALLDLLKNSLKLRKLRNPLSKTGFQEYKNLADPKIYWNPKD